MEASQINLNNICAQFSFLNSLSYSEGLRKDYPSVFEQMWEETQEMRKGRLPPNWKRLEEEEEIPVGLNSPELDVRFLPSLIEMLGPPPRKVIASLPAN